MAFKRFYLLILFVFVVKVSCAQDLFRSSETHSFVDYSKNVIITPADRSPMQSFLKKLRELREKGKGQINVVQMGGSHVQADFWTRTIREDFNLFLNQEIASRGMLFPYKAVKTNGSIQFDVTFNESWEGLRNVKMPEAGKMGLLGWSATARDSGQYIEVTLLKDSISEFLFDKLYFFHDTGDTVFAFTVTVDDSTYIPKYDSELGCSVVEPVCRNNIFRITVHRTDSLQNYFTLYGVSTTLNMPGLTYHSVGVNGAAVHSYLKCDDLEHQLGLLNPDLIIFSIGINDSFDGRFTSEWYEGNYNELIKRIRSTCPDAALLFMTNSDSYKSSRRKYYRNHNGKEVQRSMYNLAMHHNGSVWDLYAVMGGLTSISTWKRKGYAKKDLVHFNAKGYALIGDLFFEAMMCEYENLSR